MQQAPSRFPQIYSCSHSLSTRQPGHLFKTQIWSSHTPLFKNILWFSGALMLKTKTLGVEKAWNVPAPVCITSFISASFFTCSPCSCHWDEVFSICWTGGCMHACKGEQYITFFLIGSNILVNQTNKWLNFRHQQLSSGEKFWGARPFPEPSIHWCCYNMNHTGLKVKLTRARLQ